MLKNRFEKIVKNNIPINKINEKIYINQRVSTTYTLFVKFQKFQIEKLIHHFL